MSIISNQIGALEYLTAQNIPVPHCFTTRLGGVSTGCLASMNLGLHRGDDPARVAENYRILGCALGFSVEDLVLTRQIHSDIIRRVGRADCMGLNYDAYPICDALITNEPGVALVVFTADCTPLLFYDPVTGAVGAAHAGWRGTAAAIGPKTVAAMIQQFGCKAGDIRAAIGPNIGPCHFETGPDVPEAMVHAFGSGISDCIRQAGEKYYVNLKEINARILRQIGVAHIEISNACTMCQPQRFWSHRVTQGHRGSQGAVIACKEGAQ